VAILLKHLMSPLSCLLPSSLPVVSPFRIWPVVACCDTPGL
jgi:hypothetical protein